LPDTGDKTKFSKSVGKLLKKDWIGVMNLTAAVGKDENLQKVMLT
jgi:hypothetical protein